MTARDARTHATLRVVGSPDSGRDSHEMGAEAYDHMFKVRQVLPGVRHCPSVGTNACVVVAPHWRLRRGQDLILASIRGRHLQAGLAIVHRRRLQSKSLEGKEPMLERGPSPGAAARHETHIYQVAACRFGPGRCARRRSNSRSGTPPGRRAHPSPGAEGTFWRIRHRCGTAQAGPG